MSRRRDTRRVSTLPTASGADGPGEDPSHRVADLFSAPLLTSSQHTPSDRNRKKVEYPALKPEEIPPLMTVISK